MTNVTDIDTKYEDGFKAGVKCGQEEIDRTQGERHDDEELGTHMTQLEFDASYPLTLAQLYASWESPPNSGVLILNTIKHLVIKPEPTDPKRQNYNDGFIDGLCCILIANSDILMENLGTPLADAWKDQGWHKAFARAAHRAGYPRGTKYSPDIFRLVKVS
jgi:hypothetical protein